MKKTVFLLSGLLFALLSEASYPAPGDSAAMVLQTSADSLPDPASGVAHFGFGRPAIEAEIAILDIDIRPDGKGLPAGTGIATTGRAIFDQKCAACHGVGGIGGPQGSLVVSVDSTGKRKEKTIGNYWPYATTIFDYIRRAMPFQQPGSLSNEEVYHLTAYLLFANHITTADQVIDAVSLPKIIMPAQQYYVPDDRAGGPVIK